MGSNSCLLYSNSCSLISQDLLVALSTWHKQHTVFFLCSDWLTFHKLTWSSKSIIIHFRFSIHITSTENKQLFQNVRSSPFSPRPPCCRANLRILWFSNMASAGKKNLDPRTVSNLKRSLIGSRKTLFFKICLLLITLNNYIYNTTKTKKKKKL